MHNPHRATNDEAIGLVRPPGVHSDGANHRPQGLRLPENAVEMSASMPATLRTGQLNRQTFRYFRDFKQSQDAIVKEEMAKPPRIEREFGGPLALVAIKG